MFVGQLLVAQGAVVLHGLVRQGAWVFFVHRIAVGAAHRVGRRLAGVEVPGQRVVHVVLVHLGKPRVHRLPRPVDAGASLEAAPVALGLLAKGRAGLVQPALQPRAFGRVGRVLEVLLEAVDLAQQAAFFGNVVVAHLAHLAPQEFAELLQARVFVQLLRTVSGRATGEQAAGHRADRTRHRAGERTAGRAGDRPERGGRAGDGSLDGLVRRLFAATHPLLAVGARLVDGVAGVVDALVDAVGGAGDAQPFAHAARGTGHVGAARIGGEVARALFDGLCLPFLQERGGGLCVDFGVGQTLWQLTVQTALVVYGPLQLGHANEADTAFPGRFQRLTGQDLGLGARVVVQLSLPVIDPDRCAGLPGDRVKLARQLLVDVVPDA